MRICLTVLFAVAWFGSASMVAQKDPMRISFTRSEAACGAEPGARRRLGWA